MTIRKAVGWLIILYGSSGLSILVLVKCAFPG